LLFPHEDEQTMPCVQQAQIRNRLLAQFPPEDFGRMASLLELVDLPRRFAYTQPDEIGEFSYFPESGIGSIVAPSPEGQSAEIGIFGREAMTPVAVILKASSDPYSTFMQVAGNGYRIRSTDLVATRATLLKRWWGILRRQRPSRRPTPHLATPSTRSMNDWPAGF
jgi:hypothetical protein